LKELGPKNLNRIVAQSSHTINLLKREQKKTTEQDTPQDKERLKITPSIQENQDKEQHRRATTNHRKAIPKEQQIGADFITK
jgi:hypothetical protein